MQSSDGPAAGTRASREARHAKLLKRCEFFKPKTAFGAEIMALCKAVLEANPPGSEEDPPHEILLGVKASLPPARSVFTEEYFRSPAFPVVLLEAVMHLYDAAFVSEETIQSIGMSDGERANTGLMTQVWLADVLDCDVESIRTVREQYLYNRGSANPLRNGRKQSKQQSNSSAHGSQTADLTAPIVPGVAPAAPLQALQEQTGSLPGVDTANIFGPSHLSQDNRIAQGIQLHPGPAIYPPQTPIGFPSQSDEGVRHTGDPAKKASGVQYYFRHDKFSGDISQSIEMTVRDYDICANQLQLTSTQKADFFVNVFKGPARHFFFEHYKPSMSYPELIKMMKAEYDSDARQIQVHHELESIRFSSFMLSNEITDESAGLTALVNKINLLTPQCPPKFRSEENKTHFLRNAVRDAPWAFQAIAQLPSMNYSFNDFVTALRGCLVLTNEVSAAQGASRTHHAMMSALDTWYERYGRNPRDVRKHDTPGTHSARMPHGGIAHNIREGKNGRDKNGNPRECYGCGSLDHFRRQKKCNPGAVREYQRRKLQNGVPAVHVVYDIIQGMEGELHAEECFEPDPATTAVNHSDLATFDAISANDDPATETNLAGKMTDDEDTEFFTHIIQSGMDSNQNHHGIETQIINATRVHIAALKKIARRSKHHGFCVDIGAPTSVIGRKELNRILTSVNRHRIPTERSLRRFRFADAVFESLGTVELPLATPEGFPPIVVPMDIVEADIPALLGLDVLDGESLFAETVTNRLIKRVVTSEEGEPLTYVDVWDTPLSRHDDHVYAAMNFPRHVFFTRAQLVKLHRQFAHPSADRLYKLLRRARPEDTSPSILETLKDLSKRCDPCQRIQHAPRRFKVSLGAEDVRFNERLLMDIMYLDGKPVLHIVDEGTRFSAARFLINCKTETIWSTFLECWAQIYTGLPRTLLVDQGTNFGETFGSIAAMSNVTVNRTGIEAHSSLGIGERYHEPLRTTYRKLRLTYPKLSHESLLSCTVKAMNDTIGPDGLVPSSLVFGEYPTARTLTETVSPKLTLANRAHVAMTARSEMAKHMAKMKVSRALKHAVPPAADRSFEPGEQVLVWREKQVEHRIGEWLGPYEVTGSEPHNKIVYVRDSEIGQGRPFSVTQVKRYLHPEDLSRLFMDELSKSLSAFSSPSASDTFLTEIVDKNDPRANSPEMREARMKEVKGLLERGTFKVICKEELPDGANVLSARFVLAIKSTEDNKIKYKARYVIGGHRDRLKHLMVHSSQTLQPSSARLTLALASLFGFEVWTADVTQAYLQSADGLMRDVFIRNPSSEFELDKSKCLKLLRPLYGLCESGDLWHATLDKHLREDLSMAPLDTDSALYIMMKDGLLQGLSGSYVDDLLRTGTPEFRQASRKTHEKFEMSEDEDLPVTFAGFQLSGDKTSGYTLDQNQYLRKLEELESSATFSEFRSMRMKVAWLSNSRPDCLFEISQLAQITETMFNDSKSACLKDLNRTVRFALKNPMSISFPRLDSNTLQIVGFSDASFANNRDFSSQLGYIVLLADGQGNAIPLSYKSYKARRVTRSVMAAEVIAFSDMFDAAFALSSELKKLLSKQIPLRLLTDSKSLFDVISKGSRTSEKRMMIDIAAAREGYKSKAISDIGFVRSSKNLADGLTKTMNQAALQTLMRTAKLSVEPEQWIIRN